MVVVLSVQKKGQTMENSPVLMGLSSCKRNIYWKGTEWQELSCLYRRAFCIKQQKLPSFLGAWILEGQSAWCDMLVFAVSKELFSSCCYVVLAKLCHWCDCIFSLTMLLRQSVTSWVWFRTSFFFTLCAWHQEKYLEKENAFLSFNS